MVFMVSLENIPTTVYYNIHNELDGPYVYRDEYLERSTILKQNHIHLSIVSDVSAFSILLVSDYFCGLTTCLLSRFSPFVSTWTSKN